MMMFLPWWLGALALFTTAIVHLVVVRRSLGVSGAVNTALSSGARDQAALNSGGTGRSRSVAFLVGCVLGGALFVVLMRHGAATLELAPAGTYAKLFGAWTWPALFVGGVLVGAGTSMAGGCTSGHGLVGCGRLQIPSFIATACFFGTPIALSLVARAVFLKDGVP